MKRIKKYLLIIMFILGISFNVKAANFNYYLSNSEQSYNYVDKNTNKAISVKRGDIIVVTAIVDNKDNVSSYQINKGKLNIRWDEKFFDLQQVNGKYYNDANTDISGLVLENVNKTNNKLTIGKISSTGSLKNGKNKIVEFKFQVLNSATTGTSKIYQMDGEDSLTCIETNAETNEINCGESLYSELKYIIEKSNINKLSSIKINGHSLDYFNEDTNDYDFEVDTNVDKVNIDVTKKDESSILSGNIGDYPVQYGLNKFVINVISESGVRNTYNINITRTDLRSNDNSLKTITLSNGEIDFKPGILEYNVTVENEVDKITIKSSLNDSKAKYVEDYKEKTIDLVEGSNKVEIKVVSEKGEEKAYTININRSLSSNNSLKSLKINDDKIELKETEFTYNFSVLNDVNEVIIKAEANDSKATVKVDDKYPLEVGDNEIKIIVVAASGNEAIYTLNITREKLLSRDSLLTSIKINGYDIDFKQEKTVYDLKIKDNDNQLEITTTQEDPNATVEIEGNKDLENGSIIKINVKAEDGTFTRYFINIEKGSKGISPVIIIIIVLLILLGGCLGLIFYRKKKKEEAEFDKLDETKNEVKEDNEIKEEFNKEDLVKDTKENEVIEETDDVVDENTVDNGVVSNLHSDNDEEEIPVNNEISNDKKPLTRSKLYYDENDEPIIYNHHSEEDKNKDVE